MSIYTFTHSATMVVYECVTCGMSYGFTADFDKRRRDDGANFYCPRGHSQSFGDTTIAKLERQLAAEQKRAANLRDDLQVEAAAHVQTKRKLTRVIDRAHAGLCPKCNRHFVALERHMATKHPPETTS
jgi:hypothetical protein